MNIQQIRQELNAAPKGSREDILKRYAQMFGCSRDTIYRRIRESYGASKKVKREATIPQSLIDEIAKLKIESIRMGNAERELCTEECIKLLQDSGAEGADQLTVSTVNRRLSESGFRAQSRIVRVEAAYSNQQHQTDFSRSKYFQVKQFDAAKNDYLLVVSGHVLEYKEDEHKQRLWLCGLVDASSRVHISRGVVCGGESVLAGLEFINWVYARDVDDNPIHFLPKTLKLDNGSLGKSKAFLELLTALQIERELVVPRQKRGIQKQESTWKTTWRRFELPFAMKLKAGSSLYLSEYNEELFRFAINWMHRDHPTKNGSRFHVYQSGLGLAEQRELTTEMRTLLAKQYRRKVDATCCVSVDNQKYEVPSSRYIGKYVNVSINVNGDAVGELADEFSKPFTLKRVKGYIELGDFAHREKQTYRQSIEQQIKSESSKPEKTFPVDESNIAYLGPRVQQVTPENKFQSVQDDPEYIFPDLYAAKKYIGDMIYQHSHAETYTDYAVVFDEVLSISLRKRDIDTIWSELTNTKKAN